MDKDFLQHIEEIVTSMGYECVQVSLKSDFGKLRLQVLIDTLGGINVDDCEIVSERLSTELDNSPGLPELDKGRYYLEVSSPGIERPLCKLEDYVRFTGREARLRLSSPVEGRKTFTGVIAGTEGEIIMLVCNDDTDGEPRAIPFGSIKGANLVYRFGNESENKHSRTRRKK